MTHTPSMQRGKFNLWWLLVVAVFAGIAWLLSGQLNLLTTADKKQVAATGQPAPLEYVGSGECHGCHQAEYQLWQQSDHHKAMQTVDEGSVLGDFTDVSVEFHGIESRFYRLEDKFMVSTVGKNGTPVNLEIRNTFGFFPLQQYLVETEGGRLQALNTAWDSRPAEQGGQRWFHLQPDEAITPEHPFFWANHFQNWNSRCADCHSTNLQRNYDVAANSFSTSFSEINVACEACHGPASRHVSLAQADKLAAGANGFERLSGAALQWRFAEHADIAQPVGDASNEELKMCGGCHALRSQLAHDKASAEDFHDLNRVQLINEATYFADGQVRQEAFVVGSFLQSKMHHKGVTCSNCHNPHSGKVLASGNSVCAQCHKPQVFDSPQHHHHAQDSSGAQCVNCHMPERAIMQVDMRRDHSFTIPRPDLSLSLGVPNACTACHADQDDTWANTHTTAWGVKGGDQHWAHLLRRATQNDVLVTRPVVEAAMNTGLPDLVRASLLQHLAPMPSRVSAEVAQKGLFDKSPLVRRAAVAALQGQSGEVRWQMLSPHLNDQSRSVRMQIAETLADLVTQLPTEQQAQLAALIGEYREILAVSSDAVATQLNLANLELRLGNIDAAESAYQQALAIEPAYVPALLSLAEFYRGTGRPDEARAELEKDLLQRALQIAPDSGAAQHSMGLFYVRGKDYDRAIKHLKLAVEQADAAPYYAYVYGVALENQGQLDDAIDALKAANQRWPNQFELLHTLILYLEKSGQGDAVWPYLSGLSQIAPGAPAVRQLVEKYQNKR